MCRCSNNTNISSLAKVLSRKKCSRSHKDGRESIFRFVNDIHWISDAHGIMIYFLSPTGSICRIWFTTAHPICRNCNMTSSLIVMDSSIRRPWKFSAFNIPVGIDRNREAELFIVIDDRSQLTTTTDATSGDQFCVPDAWHDVGFSREQLDKRNQEES